MAKNFRKGLAGMISAVMAVNLAAASAMTVSVLAAEQKYEFEDGTITGATVQESGTERYQEGASGDKFVFLENGGEIASVTVNVEETGMYVVSLCYSAPYGDKIHNLLVNDVDQGQISCVTTDGTDWATVSLGSVKLNAGDNTIGIKSSWGWTNLDYLTVEAATLSPIQATDTVCADPDIIPEAQNLMNYMAAVYGNHIISGQQEIYMYGPHDFAYEFDYIEDLTGELPAIRGFDYLNEANILYGSEDGTTDRMIDWVKNKGGIITASWHVTVPKDFANFTLGETTVDWSQATYGVWADDAKTIPATDFDTSQILVEGTKEREYWMACLDKLAESIQRLEDENIPLIFRPLHEAEGGGGENGSWFFWGQDGSEVYKKLWILTYETLVNDHGLHNIIWEWNSYNFETSANWYPGDDYVDLIAYDKYNCTNWSTGQAVLEHNVSAISSTFYGIMEKYGSKKMVAMSENDSIPTLENLLAEKAGWLYFCPWYDGGSDDINFLSNPIFNTQEDLKTIYQSDYCITLDELPDDLYTNSTITTTLPTSSSTKPVETTTVSTTTTEPVATDEIKGDIELSGADYLISFDEAMGEAVYIELTAEDVVNFANGGVGISATVDGTDYWVSYGWDIAGSETLKIDLTKPTSVTYNNGEETVTDKDLIAEIAAEAQKQTNGMVQIWWANDSAGKQVESSNVVLTDAYLLKAADSSETTTTETTTSVTESITDETETTTTETVTTTAPVETTTAPVESSTAAPDSSSTTGLTEDGPLVASLYGDTNLDGKVSLVDVVYLNKYIAQTVNFTSTAVANADCVEDNKVNSADATALLEFVIEVIDALPVLPETTTE
ncbi:MAG: glycoside hydrolase [Ruminococcus sp.]|nr:glycoside hydrolase [Ruminococcus sp.]